MNPQTNTLLRWLLLLMVGVVMSACTGLAGEPDIVATLPVRATAPPAIQQPENFDTLANLETGAVIYAENCVRCHGISGAGDGVFVLNGQVSNIPDFTDPTTIADKSLQEWFDTITNGRIESLMPPWKGSLSAKDRWSVALYTYSLTYDATTVAQGEAAYLAACADCHAADGSGTDNGVPVQYLVNFTQAELQETLANHQTELEITPALADADLSAVAQYTRLLSAQTQTLPDPDTVIQALPPPAATEDAGDAVAAAPESTPVEIPQSIGILRGRIIQGTEGGDPVEGLEAIVHIYDSQLREQIAEYTVGADGTYRYDEVVIRPDFAYRMTTDYKGITYSSPVVLGDPDTTDMVVDVIVYEPGATERDLVITSRATQVNLSSQGLYIIEVIDMLNTSDRAYLREAPPEAPDLERASVGFALPEGAQLQLDLTDPERIALSDDGLTVLDMMPVLPGVEHYVQYSYLLPIANADAILQPIDYTVAGPIAFYIENSHLGFTSAQTALSETRPFNGQNYNVYTVSEDPAIGDILTYSVELLANPGTGAPGDVQPVPREVLALMLVIGGIVLIGGAASVLYRGREQDAPASPVTTTPEALMQEIAELDNAFDSGDINKADYQKQRNRLKEQLMQVMKAQDNDS